MRPRGDIGRALLEAAWQPGTVNDLAERAQVGRHAAKYTASRLIGRGELEVVVPGRPALLRRADVHADVVETDGAPQSFGAPLQLHELWWGQPART